MITGFSRDKLKYSFSLFVYFYIIKRETRTMSRYEISNYGSKILIINIAEVVWMIPILLRLR